jgi:hypothetical protein
VSPEILAEIQHAPRYAPTRRILRLLRLLVLPWESLLGTLGAASLVGLANGLQLLMPGSTFGSNPGAFSVLERMLPEQALGWLFVTASVVGMVSLNRRSHHWQVISGATLAGTYTYLAAGLLPTSPNGLGWPTYGALAAGLTISVMARLWKESRDGAE